MSITRVKASSLTQGLPKRKTVLAGNDVILPGSYESIQTVTVGSGGQATVSFTSIPSTYSHLQVRVFARDLRAATYVDSMFVYCNADTTGANYYTHYISGNGTAASAASDVGQNSYGIAIGLTTATSSTSAYATNIIDILDYSNTSKNKTFRSLHGLEDNTNGLIRLRSSLWMSTAAISSLTFNTSSGGNNFAQYSSFALYGIK